MSGSHSLRFCSSAFSSERTHQIHHTPAQLLRLPVAFRRHFSLALRNDVEELAIRLVPQRRCIAPIAHCQLHRLHQFALTVSMLAVTHRAIVTKHFPRFRQTFRRRFHRIFPRHVLGRNLVLLLRGFGGFRSLLLQIPVCTAQTGARGTQCRAHSDEKESHIFLLCYFVGPTRGFPLPFADSTPCGARKDTYVFV